MIGDRGLIYRLALGHLGIDIYMSVIPAVIPLLVSEGGVSFLLAGLLLTAYNTTSSLVQPIFGWLADARGRSVPIAVAMLVGGVAIGLIGVVDSFPVLFLLAALAGLMHAAFHPIAKIVKIPCAHPRLRIVPFPFWLNRFSRFDVTLKQERLR